MATETLFDELLSIACPSADKGEFEQRFGNLVRSHGEDREALAAEVRHSIGALHLQANTMETWVFMQTRQRATEKMNLVDWVAETRGRAEELRREADDLERVAIASGVIDPPNRPETLRGMWKGMKITDEDIEEAKRSLFKAAYDDTI